ncbi:UNVERIFIED_CONTAM: hypothetical protein GTU68_048153 [Idotea baltica]|nr:hypothetical protein [Idotea baltica]
MGKTTNALEELLKISRSGQDFQIEFEQLVNNHSHTINELFGKVTRISALDVLFKKLYANLGELKDSPYDYAYDQVVSFGELISTMIVYAFLKDKGQNVSFLDAREMIITDDTYREGIVNWERTIISVKDKIEKKDHKHIYITQGFIGSNQSGKTTTLGREGSDFTAAIISFCIDAENMAIWKDVPGILTADPRLFENVAKIDRLSYREAIEMTYYGAKVIHPKTIKPIQNKNIPLWVKSFLNPNGIGTLISGEIELTYPPMIVIEPEQALIHISTKDFSFVGEEHLSKLFQIFNNHRIRVNMMRNTAISFSVCTNNLEDRIDNLRKDLQEDFNMVVDHGLELITIRHYTEDLVKKLKKGKIQLFEERLRQTIQMVVKDVPDMIRK